MLYQKRASIAERISSINRLGTDSQTTSTRGPILPKPRRKFKTRQREG